MNNSVYIDYNSIFRPSKETIHRNKKLWNDIEQQVSIKRQDDGFEAEIKNLNLSFIDKMEDQNGKLL